MREVFGELTDWRQGLSLPCDIDPPVGVYQYKIRDSRDGRVSWELDANNPRTRSAGGIRNSLLGGAPEPWLFAPVAPWVVGSRILVGVRGAAAPSVSWSEGDSWSSDRLKLAFEEDEHRFYTATLPLSAARASIVLSAAGAPDIALAWEREAAAGRLPEWWRRAVLYGVFVDRFRPALDRPSWEIVPTGGAAAGGHLDGVTRALDEIEALGANVIYLTPVHVGASAHRYDIVDPLVVDPALGGEEAYAALIRAVRARGMRVIQDVSFAHAGRGFPPYEDVLVNGARSRFAAWFQWKDGALAQYGKRTDAPLFDLENAEVRDLAIRTIEGWARRGVSGLRLDMTAEVPIALAARIRRRFRELVPDGVVFGELVPQHAWRWRNAGVIDAATDFDFQEAIGELLAGRMTAEAAYQHLSRTTLLRGDDPHLHAVRFLSTHDHVRLASKVGSEKLPLAVALLATLPGIPMLLYGEEHALRSDDPHRGIEDAWPDRMPMPWTPARRDASFQRRVTSLFQARAASPALRSGTTTLLYADDSTLIFRRAAEDVIDVVLNFAAEPKALELEDDERPRTTLLAGDASVEDARISLPAYGYALVRRSTNATLVARRNLILRDADLAAGTALATARPSRFFFAVTERCNLRCAHCITNAPEKTQSGSARTMTPAVLSALAPHFAHASYFAFVHGGESLTAPIFYDVLAAIEAARADAPYIAHLLTNGLLLDVKEAAKLHAHGVSSLSVSLDGATAATNDAIRVGGRFDQVRRQLTEVLAWRAATGADLRVGISTVVLRQNVDELVQLVDLAADLGVDWVKLEEGAPATMFAARSLIVRPNLAPAIMRGRERGLVIVDHTIDRVLWRCRLDSESAAFLAADEFANRIDIHPCRFPWETACIEPNGDVRALDVFGPSLGNALATPLDMLWNGPAARSARAAAVVTRLCGHGAITCL